jgi:hypothetical protein
MLNVLNGEAMEQRRTRFGVGKVAWSGKRHKRGWYSRKES